MFSKHQKRLNLLNCLFFLGGQLIILDNGKSFALFAAITLYHHIQTQFAVVQYGSFDHHPSDAILCPK